MELKTYFAQDRDGSLIPSASVSIFLTGTSTLASGLTNVSNTPMANPFTADSDGKIQFHAPDGIYDMMVSLGSTSGVRVTFQCLDVEQQLADANSAADRAESAAESIEGQAASITANSREQWRRTLADAGFNLVAGSFEAGATASTTKDAVWHIEGGQCYAWGGTLPKTVPSASTPGSTGGIVAGAWESVSNEILRKQISLDSYSGVNVVGTTEQRVSAQTGNVIRFCTWNIQNGYISFVYYDDPDGGDARRFNRDEDSPLYMSEINEHLLRMGIDIVGFQEVLHRWDAPISSRALYPYADAVEGRTDLDANGVTANRVYSNAVMSTKAISSSSNVVLRPRVGTDDGNSLVKAIINWNGTTISMYCVHLSYLSDEIRLQQLNTVAGILSADTNTHIVIAGDFNLHLDSQYTALTSIGFTMVNNENGPTTYNGSKPGPSQHMDRLLHKGFSAQGTWAVDEIPRELGDHKPVWVDLTL